MRASTKFLFLFVLVCAVALPVSAAVDMGGMSGMTGQVSAEVVGNATVNPSTGSWDYDYTIVNNLIVSIDGLIFPFFDSACVALDCSEGDPGILDLSDIIMPFGWNFSWLDPDPWPLLPGDSLYVPGVPEGAFLDPEFVLIFSTNTDQVQPGNSLDGFGFASSYGPTDGPVFVRFGSGGGGIDPLMPNTPNFPSAVPIPAAVLLFGSGMIGLLAVARGKKARR